VGVGVAAIQIGKMLGARVVAAASSPEKLAFCKENGADEVIDYTKEDLKERAKAFAPNVIFDPVGGAFAEQALRAIAWEGRYPSWSASRRATSRRSRSTSRS